MSDDTIQKVHAREVLDSRGQPTVEVEVHCRGGAWGRAVVPSGASTGTHEARELRDAAEKRHAGKGVRQAVHNVRSMIGPRIVGRPASEQEKIDRLMIELDGSPDKSSLGANAILGVSLACAHAAAAARRLPLWQYLDRDGRATMPLPMVNLISGGLHAGGNLDFQDFLLLPTGARSYSEALEMTCDVYRSLSRVLRKHGFEGVLVGDEGGFGPRLSSNEQAVEMILQAIREAGLQPGRDAGLALDVAATHFFEPDESAGGVYRLKAEAGRGLTADEMIDRCARWVDSYPLFSIEDALVEHDFLGWATLTRRLEHRAQLIGDDLFCTNAARLREGIGLGAANAVLVKVNQIGTLTEADEVVRLARAAGYRAVISARSGETEDTTLADLAVAWGTGQIKIGSVARSERLAKYNQLLRIEEDLGADRFWRWTPPAVA
jgi:enolase